MLPSLRLPQSTANDIDSMKMNLFSELSQEKEKEKEEKEEEKEEKEELFNFSPSNDEKASSSSIRQKIPSSKASSKPIASGSRKKASSKPEGNQTFRKEKQSPEKEVKDKKQVTKKEEKVKKVKEQRESSSKKKKKKKKSKQDLKDTNPSSPPSFASSTLSAPGSPSPPPPPSNCSSPPQSNIAGEVEQEDLPSFSFQKTKENVAGIKEEAKQKEQNEDEGAGATEEEGKDSLDLSDPLEGYYMDDNSMESSEEPIKLIKSKKKKRKILKDVMAAPFSFFAPRPSLKRFGAQESLVSENSGEYDDYGDGVLSDEISSFAPGMYEGDYPDPYAYAGTEDIDTQMLTSTQDSDSDENTAIPCSTFQYVVISQSQQAAVIAEAKATKGKIEKTPLIPLTQSFNDLSWNDMFQNAYDKVNKMKEQKEESLSPQSKIEAFQSLSSLSKNFLYTAELYGKIIIAEKQLPFEKKTIKPNKNLGGIIGGVKYIVQGVLFKFAVSGNNEERGDEFAMKVANHELKSLDCLMQCRTPGLYYPLLAIVDYRGYRVIAMTTLPLDGNATLKFGSSNAGKTVHSSIPELNSLLFKTCQKLNLKEHHVGPSINPTLIPGPVDLEGHEGSDNRFYILDFSRLFPPDAGPFIKGSAFFRLLRPELVKNHHKPLCSDTFSSFVAAHHTEKVEHALEIKEAQQNLLENVIPAFATMLSSQDASLFLVDHLIHAMHREGINIRYMGNVRNALPSTSDASWANMILVEMLARTIKWDIRYLLRKTTETTDWQVPSSSDHKQNIITYLNLIFGSFGSIDYWKEKLLPSLSTRFYNPLSFDECQNVSSFRSRVISELGHKLFLRVTAIAGISFSTNPFEFIPDHSPSSLFDSCDPFDLIHLGEFTSRVKQLSVVEQANGWLLLLRAKLSNNKHFAIQMLHLSLSRFEKALECNPSDKVSLLQCAKINAKLNLPRARAYFTYALQADPNCPTVNYSFARYVHKLKEAEEEIMMVEEHYVRAIRHNPQHYKAMYFYATLLQESKRKAKDNNLIEILMAKVKRHAPDILTNKSL